MFRNVLESINDTMTFVLYQLAEEYKLNYDDLLKSYAAIIGGEKKQETCKYVVGNRFCKNLPKYDGFCFRHCDENKKKPKENAEPVFLQNPYHTSMLRFNSLK